ncbi:MAG: alpha-glucan family phosphorylase [Planctomycetota bacterium]
MRPLRAFTIEPSLPEELSALLDVAYNVWWSWHGDALNLFRRLDHVGWDETYHNPVAMLGRIDQSRLEEMAHDEGFKSHLRRVHKDLQDYLTQPGWWTRTYGPQQDNQPLVAYFCAEFGITESLPIYSGGLGVLAGDHLKSASDLGIPLVAVGLLYQQGYFRQRLNADGWQLELFPRNDFANMPVALVRGADGGPLMATVEMCGRQVHIQTWKVNVGRISLYLMDTNVPGNTPEDRQITSQLYGGDQEMRIKQEIVLGIGGVRFLRAAGLTPRAFHMNEGHSAFLGLERIRLLMHDKGISFGEAWEAVSASNVFTSHTPVPAGNDAFDPPMIDKYFSHYWQQLGLSRDAFLATGRQDAGNREEPMSLTVLALKLSTCRNGVSELHGQVSRKLWANVWPGLPVEEIPIESITNGIHTRSWISSDMASIYDMYLGPDWQEKPADMAVWRAAERIPDTELWRTHERRRERLVAFARERLGKQLALQGAGASELAAAQEILDPEVLTIGFARRFATYKRASLILADLERLTELLNAQGRRVQIIFAGKAHPRDNPGKDLIRHIVHTCRQEAFRKSMVFLEDYDINVARYLVQGVDVWLNTPLRPMEASGTSGMKVAANGGLNVSILDGWWCEGYHASVGWVIGSGESYDDLEYQNTVESQALYNLLEKEVVPLFYDRGTDKLPRGWIARMRANMCQLAPVFNTNRMVRQYAEQFYSAAAGKWTELLADNVAGAKTLAGWKQHVRNNFHAVRIESVQDDMAAAVQGARVGRNIHVEAVIHHGALRPEDLLAELYYGPLDSDGRLQTGQAIAMQPVGPAGDARVRYAAEMPCERSGMTGYTIRILPCHPQMANPRDMALVKWA